METGCERPYSDTPESHCWRNIGQGGSMGQLRVKQPSVQLPGEEDLACLVAEFSYAGGASFGKITAENTRKLNKVTAV